MNKLKRFFFIEIPFWHSTCRITLNNTIQRKSCSQREGLTVKKDRCLSVLLVFLLIIARRDEREMLVTGIATCFSCARDRIGFPNTVLQRDVIQLNFSKSSSNPAFSLGNFRAPRHGGDDVCRWLYTLSHVSVPSPALASASSLWATWAHLVHKKHSRQNNEHR